MDENVLYPHHTWIGEDRDKVKRTLSCGGCLMPMWIVGRDAEDGALWCVGCNKQVYATKAEMEQAERAAKAEGARPPERGAVVPGTLPDVVRRALALRYWHENHIEQPGFSVDGTWDKAWRDAGGYLSALGLVHDDGTPNDEGRRLMALCGAPEVPVDRLVTAPRFYVAPKSPKAARKRAEAPVAPMVCECGHGVRVHMGRGLTDACGEHGCDCKRYRQSKPQKEPAS